MKGPRHFIFVNGIFNSPGSASGWTDRAATWVNVRTKDKAEKFEYFAGAISRRLFIRSHANNLAHLISQYAERRLVLVGHSNGCELLCRALRVSGVAVEALHLISGACTPCFNKNGLNDLLLNGRIKRINVYVGEQDLPMRIARWTGCVLGVLGLGYGTLGYRGPVNVEEAVKDRVKTISKPDFGHSTWFEPEHFHHLMIEVAMR